MMTGKKKTEERTIYWRTFQRAKQKAPSDGKWKYLQDEKGEYLFDLLANQGEKNDLKEKQGFIFNRLKKMYAKWEKTLLQPIPLYL